MNNSVNNAIELGKKQSKEKTDKFKNNYKESVTDIRENFNRKENVNDLLGTLTESQKQIMKDTIRYKKARENYLDYLQLCYPEYVVTPFHYYLAKICQTIVERIESGKKVKILLSVPCRHGKSRTVTETLPSYFVGRNPDKHAILTAYNADLASKFEDNNRKLTKQFGKKVFGIEVSDTQDNKTEYQIKEHTGSVMGVGIQGGITGNGGELIIVDDPYKNSVEANSPATRKMIEDTFRDSVFTRLQGKGNAILVIQTRWHEEDLCGVLSQEDGWIVINIPCVCDNPKTDILHRKLGETLCPQLGFDTEWAMATKKQVGEKVWEALYQGHPSIDGGEIFTREMIHFYTNATLPNRFDEQVISCDLSFGGTKKTNDPVAIQVWGRVGANHFLLKRIKKLMTFKEMCDTIKIVSATYPQARKKIVEKKANGQAIIETLNKVVGGIEAYDPKMESKVGRANSVVPLWASGNIFLPDKTIDKTIDEFVEELMKFPNSIHDDEVDAMTQYLVGWQYVHSGRVSTESTYKILNKVFRGIKL